eukprot:UN00740
MMTTKFIEPLNMTYRNTKTKLTPFTRKMQIDELQWEQYKQRMWVHLQHRLSVLQATEVIAGPRNIVEVVPWSVGKMIIYSTFGTIFFIVNKMKTKSSTKHPAAEVKKDEIDAVGNINTVSGGNSIVEDV